MDETDLDDEPMPSNRLILDLLREATDGGATDIFLTPTAGDMEVQLRIQDTRIDRARIRRSMVPSVLGRIKGMAGVDISERRRPQAGRIQFDGPELKACVEVFLFPTVHGEALRLALGEREPAPAGLADLALPSAVEEQVRRVLAARNGVLLVAGVSLDIEAGLAALVGEVAATGARALLVSYSGRLAAGRIPETLLNTSIGFSMDAALRAAVEQDFQYVMLADVADCVTARELLAAAARGRLLIAGIHTRLATEAPRRLLDMGVEPWLLRMHLSGVLALRRVRVLCPECRVAEAPSAELQGRLAKLPGGAPGQTFRARGCARCSGTGYDGRATAAEFLGWTPELARLAVETQDPDVMRAAAFPGGAGSLEVDVAEKVRTGAVASAELLDALS